MRKILLLALCTINVALFAQNDSLNIKAKKGWKYGTFFGITEESFVQWNWMVDEYQLFPEKVNGKVIGVSFERYLFPKTYLRFEPRVILKVMKRPANAIGFNTITQTETQIPVLLKFQPFKERTLNPFVIGGYLASIEFGKKDELLFPNDNHQRITHSLEYGLGVDLALKKAIIGLSVRAINRLNNNWAYNTSFEYLEGPVFENKRYGKTFEPNWLLFGFNFQVN